MEIKQIVKDPSDYFKRQERVKFEELSFNHEQYRRYTDTFKKAKAMDDAHQKNLYKLVRYVKQNKDNESDALVNKFLHVDKFDPDLIDVPEEFAELPLEDIAHNKGRKLARRQFIRKRSSTSLVNYDAWRTFDRKVLKGDGRHYGVGTLFVAPAQLVRTFGMPDFTEILTHGTG